MKNTIRLDIDHSDKTRVEAFLNRVERNLEQIPFDAQDLNGVDNIVGGFKFKVKDQPTFVIVIFATSYSHANEICAANSESKMNWTINGAILFGVQSTDENTSREILSFFAGRE
jgi:hypothetical protein